MSKNLRVLTPLRLGQRLPGDCVLYQDNLQTLKYLDVERRAILGTSQNLKEGLLCILFCLEIVTDPLRGEAQLPNGTTALRQWASVPVLLLYVVAFVAKSHAAQKRRQRM